MRRMFSYTMAIVLAAMTMLAPMAAMASPAQQGSIAARGDDFAIAEGETAARADDFTMIEGGTHCSDGFVIAGVWHEKAGDDKGKLFYARYDINGNIKWSYKGMEAETNIENHNRIKGTSDGGGIAFYSREGGETWDTFYYDNFVYKFDANGNIQWQKKLSDNYKSLRMDGLNETSYGYLILASHSVIRLDKQGNVLSVKSLNIPSDQYFTGMNEDFSLYGWRSSLAQLNENGEFVAGPFNIGANGCIYDEPVDGGRLVLYDKSSEQFTPDLIKYDKNLKELWRQSLPKPSGGMYEGVYVANGKYYVQYFSGSKHYMRVYDSNGNYINTIDDFIYKAITDKGYSIVGENQYWPINAHHRVYIFVNGSATGFKAYVDLKPYIGGGSTTTPETPEKPETTQPKNGWEQQGNTWYYYTNNTAATGWKKIGSTWYLFGSNGAMLTGWQKEGGKWYYLKPSGAMATGWVQNGKWYFLDGSGAMKTGWVKDGNSWYFLKTDGAMVASDWVQSGGKWYYMNGSGKMVTGTQKIGSKTYRFNASGAWIG